MPPSISGIVRQTGFSLVELMVAMALGLLISAAAISLFSTSRRTFELQQAGSQLQQRGQLAMRFIAGDVRLAGFADPESDAPVLPGIVTEITDGLPGSADGGAGNDRITVSYLASEDCEGHRGEEAQGRARVVNSYWVDQRGYLMCEGNLARSLTGGVKLLAGVRGFQVLYGVDDNQDGIPFAARYVTANAINGRVVLSVKLSLLLEAEGGALDKTEARTWYLLDQDVSTAPARALFRRFTVSVALRNYPWSRI